MTLNSFLKNSKSLKTTGGNLNKMFPYYTVHYGKAF